MPESGISGLTDSGPAAMMPVILEEVLGRSASWLWFGSGRASCAVIFVSGKKMKNAIQGSFAGEGEILR